MLKPGLFTTIQDTGRHGYLKYGVPVSGAMDMFSLTAANTLVGNHVNCACLETTLIGPELQALADTQIAIAGGDCTPRIKDNRVPMWHTLSVHEKDVVSFENMKSGCRAYVAVRGGVDSPVLLDSRSTYVRGGFGGMEGRQLKAGDTVETGPTRPLGAEYSLPRELIPQFDSDLAVHVVLGPQADMFTDEGVKAFLRNPYKITPEADRMGYRLEGPPIKHRSKADIVSDALLLGAIQVPKNQQPIIMMKDAQTTGGYPKIAAAVTSDLDMLGQAKPNDRIRFSKTTVKQAHEDLRRYLNLLDGLATRLVEEPV